MAITCLIYFLNPDNAIANMSIKYPDLQPEIFTHDNYILNFICNFHFSKMIFDTLYIQIQKLFL